MGWLPVGIGPRDMQKLQEFGHLCVRHKKLHSINQKGTLWYFYIVHHGVFNMQVQMPVPWGKPQVK